MVLILTARMLLFLGLEVILQCIHWRSIEVLHFVFIGELRPPLVWDLVRSLVMAFVGMVGLSQDEAFVHQNSLIRVATAASHALRTLMFFHATFRKLMQEGAGRI
jgi:hypothetical protein